jgi:enhancing lycopene biosynthesis protein 2
MAKRVAVVLSGCGAGDGSEIREAVLTLLTLERAGAQAIFAAPDATQARVFDHQLGVPAAEAQPRQVRAEAARIARGPVRPLSELRIEEIDALIFPGGEGVATVLSNYADKGQLCDVDPDVARLLKEALARHRPMGFICLAPILAARVLGPIAGVRVTLGPRATGPAKHAAVMGADVRPCNANDIFIDNKTRVISTPAYMYEGARLTEVAQGIEKLVRSVLHLARDRQPAPRPPGTAAAPPGAKPAPPDQQQSQNRDQQQDREQQPRNRDRAPERRRVTPARGSV